MENKLIDLVGLGARIHSTRSHRKLSMDQLAIKVGCTKGVIRKYEQALVDHPSIIFIDKIANSLKVSLEWLCYGDEDEELIHKELDRELESNYRKSISMLDIYHKRFILQALEMALDESIRDQQARLSAQNRRKNYSSSRDISI